MKPIVGALQADMAASLKAGIEADFGRELAEIETESMGWLALGEGAYVHVGSDARVVEVVGQPTPAMASTNVLWLA